MPLTGKYLKYSPEITLEIFTLVWSKLESLFPTRIYDWTKDWSLESFKKHRYISIWGNNDKYTFGINNNPGLGNEIETTVQEILGYDPFVKDDFVLPEKWCIERNSQNYEVINEYINKNWYKAGDKARNENNFIYKSNNPYGWTSKDIKPEDYTEITFDQFKKYVLKESIETSKEVIPEYVECIENTTQNPVGIVLGKIYKVLSKTKCSCTDLYLLSDTKCNSSSKQCWDCNEKVPSNSYKVSRFKPSTKEAFDAQNKSIEKWSVGSYFVIEKDRLYAISSSKRGDICIIKEDKTFNFTNKKDQTNWCFDFREGSRWFATKVEAEEFAKTLVEPVEDEYTLDMHEEMKQPLKQAVHCKTQEEWDFVLSKFNPLKLESNFFKKYKENSCISLERGGYGTSNIAYAGYKILSFQEWCDLNGYKMETNQEFKVGDWVITNGYSLNYDGKVLKITKISQNRYAYFENSKNPTDNFDLHHIKRHATPEEINNHLISIGQIPIGDPLNTGIELNKDGIFNYTMIDRSSFSSKCSTTITRTTEIVKSAIEFNYLPEPE